MNRGRRREPDHDSGGALKHGILLTAAFIALVPTIYMISTALKSQEEYVLDKVGFPSEPVPRSLQVCAHR